MAQAIINLAFPVIQNKVEEILDTYPTSPYQRIFSSRLLREKLVAHVISRMPALYTTVEESRTCSVDTPANCFSSEEQHRMDRLIRSGIQHLMAEYQTWEEAVQLSTVAGRPSPSTWFG